MNSGKSNRYWKIQGRDGTDLLFERKVLLGQITENNMKLLLKTLTAKISLTEDEIIGSYAKKGTKIHLDHLEVKYMLGGPYMLSCGSNPYVIATVENDL